MIPCSRSSLPLTHIITMLAALSPVAYAPTVAPASVRTRAAVSMSFGDDFTVEARPWSSGEVSDAAGLERPGARDVREQKGIGLLHWVKSV